MGSAEEQKIINDLQANWVWPPGWVDSSALNTGGRIVEFSRELTLPSAGAGRALLHCTADTRYKLYVNGVRVAVGPVRSSSSIWYYDTLDIGPHLRAGRNELRFVVLRYFAASRCAMPFVRMASPGLTVVGRVEAGDASVELDSRTGWQAQVNENILFPMGLIDDGFLHINERVAPAAATTPVTPLRNAIRTVNGELSPWRLRPRAIPQPEESHVAVDKVRSCQSTVGVDEWTAYLAGRGTVTLPWNSSHTLEIQADVHSTAFLRWTFSAAKHTQVSLKVTYSEGYELHPRSYPFFRVKGDRLDAENGHIIGPCDQATLNVGPGGSVTYEPFWFRTFHVLRLEISVGSEPVELTGFEATQVNYPLAAKASWHLPSDSDSARIWDVSIRTLRNCMFDGYSDCPFYEQLQYSGDSRSVGLFHYLLSGDDRLMRQAITNFAASVTPEGLTQSRFPSSVPQIIAGFSLYWVLQVCDHHLFFGDTPYARSFLPRIDGVFDFYDRHVDSLGLISGMPEDVWQYVDWVLSWDATAEHPDKGVPTSGRRSNRHTYFSMLYAYVLRKAARLVRDVGRPGYAEEYEARADSLTKAIQAHCYDGSFFTDSTADIADDLAYSQHCQVFGVLCGAAAPAESGRILREAFAEERFAKCSYVMRFYALRAFALAGDHVYEGFWPQAWDPWRRMLADNMSTWEEDNVRQRSDCHAWGSVPIYEYCTELAGVQPIAPGSSKLLFKPRLGLSEELEAKVALGKDNVATVSWTTQSSGEMQVSLRLEKAVELISKLPGGDEKEHGIVDKVTLVHHAT